MAVDSVLELGKLGETLARQDDLDDTVKGLNGFVLNRLLPELRSKYIRPNEKIEIHLSRKAFTPGWQGFGWMPGYIQVTSQDYGDPVVVPYLQERKSIIPFRDVKYEFQVSSHQIALREIQMNLIVQSHPGAEHGAILSSVHDCRVVYVMESKTFHAAELENILAEIRTKPVPINMPQINVAATREAAAIVPAAEQALYTKAGEIEEVRRKLIRDGSDFIKRSFSATTEEGRNRVESFLRQWYARFEKNPTLEDLVPHLVRTIHSEVGKDTLLTDEDIDKIR